MSYYWAEFSTIAVAHLLAVASPGPDFAVVLKQSLRHGRRPALWTSAGIGTAILLHVGYSLLGIGLLVRSSPLVLDLLTYAGAAYIAWLGVQGLRARPAPPRAHSSVMAADGGVGESRSGRGAFAMGFLTNALNPKATLFFISLFMIGVSPQTPKLVQAAYGVWLAMATAAWFSLVSIFFAQARVRDRFWRYGHWIDRGLGVVFIALALSLVWGKLG